MSREGWICPRCQIVHAPWMPSCNCYPGTGVGVTKPTLPWKKVLGTTGSDDLTPKPTSADEVRDE